jgi:hypothetical protein
LTASSLETRVLLPDELCVMLDLGAVVCALPTRWVSRLVLLDEARLLDGAGGLLDVGGHIFAAWELSDLLGVELVPRAWVLMNLPHRGKTVPIALSTGACLLVDVLGPTLPVPIAMFRARGAAFPAGFDVTSRRKTSQAVVGLCFDPSGLFTPDELESSARRLQRWRERS